MGEGKKERRAKGKAKGEREEGAGREAEGKGKTYPHRMDNCYFEKNTIMTGALRIVELASFLADPPHPPRPGMGVRVKRRYFDRL